MIKLKYFGINMLISFAVAAILLFISAVIFAYTNINDIYLNTFVFVSVMISVLVGSMLTSRKIKTKGLIYGAVFGLIYCLIVYLFTVIAYKGFFISDTVLIYLGVSAGAGVIGGIIRS